MYGRSKPITGFCRLNLIMQNWSYKHYVLHLACTGHPRLRLTFYLLKLGNSRFSLCKHVQSTSLFMGDLSLSQGMQIESNCTEIDLQALCTSLSLHSTLKNIYKTSHVKEGKWMNQRAKKLSLYKNLKMKHGINGIIAKHISDILLLTGGGGLRGVWSPGFISWYHTPAGALMVRVVTNKWKYDCHLTPSGRMTTPHPPLQR